MSAENWSTHPLQRIQKWMTHHLSVPGTRPYTYGQYLTYIDLMNIAVFYIYWIWKYVPSHLLFPSPV